MTRNVCVCGKVGYTKCPVHGDPLKGPAITDEEFLEMVERHKEKIIYIVKASDKKPYTCPDCGAQSRAGERIHLPNCRTQRKAVGR